MRPTRWGLDLVTVASLTNHITPNSKPSPTSSTRFPVDCVLRTAYLTFMSVRTLVAVNVLRSGRCGTGVRLGPFKAANDRMTTT